MITKKAFANYIINDFKKKNNIPDNTKNEDLVFNIFMSSSLGVALEYLGILTKEKYPEEYIYMASRGGIRVCFYNKEDETTYTLSVRELLDMLPEEIEKGELKWEEENL